MGTFYPFFHINTSFLKFTLMNKIIRIQQNLNLHTCSRKYKDYTIAKYIEPKVQYILKIHLNICTFVAEFMITLFFIVQICKIDIVKEVLQ